VQASAAHVKIDEGLVTALVASLPPVQRPPERITEAATAADRRTLALIAAAIGRSPQDRLDELKRKVHA
jgi:hypothetical protein